MITEVSFKTNSNKSISVTPPPPKNYPTAVNATSHVTLVTVNNY